MPGPTAFIESSAEFSPCRKWRYTLKRTWNDARRPHLVFLCLNPSTADENKSDPTVTRCINKAWHLGYGGMFMLNIFAYRATDPKDMKAQQDPVGAENDKYLLDVCNREYLEGGKIVCGWGEHGSHLNRSGQVRELLKDLPLHCLILNKSGEPRHPLYIADHVNIVKMQ